MSNDPYKTNVGEVMVRDIVSVSPDDTIHDCIQRMVENRVSSMPVLGSHGQCVGIVSTSDIMDVTQEIDEDLAELETADPVTGRWTLERLMAGVGHSVVSDVMCDEVLTVSTETPIAKAARMMLRNGVHRLPVVDVREHVVGIVSTTDLLGAFVDADPEA